MNNGTSQFVGNNGTNIESSVIADNAESFNDNADAAIKSLTSAIKTHAEGAKLPRTTTE